MADLTPEQQTQLDEFFDQLKDYNKGSKEYLELQIKIQKLLKDGYDDQKKALDIAKRLNRSHSELLKEFNKGKASVSDLAKQMRKYDDALQEAEDEIKHATDQRTKTEALAAKHLLEANKKQINQMMNHVAAHAMVTGTTVGSLRAVSLAAVGAAKMLGTAAAKFAEGGDGFDIMRSVIHDAAAGAGKALDSAGNQAVEFGSALMLAGGRIIKIIGAIMSVVGLAAKAGTVALGLAQWASDMILTVAKTLRDSYVKAAAGGLVFADGMQGLANAAARAGMPIKDFAEAAAKNAELLGTSGLGVQQAMVLVGNALKNNGQQLRKDLLNLGYAYEEQADVVSNVIYNMRMSGADISKMSTGDLAKTTKEYAMNLRIISAITGDDAKKRQEQAREAQSTLMFEQKMALKPIAEQNRIRESMVGMSKMEAKNFMDRLAFGTVVNKEGAMFEATNAAARRKGLEAFQAYTDHTASMGKTIKRNTEYADGVINDANKNTAIGLASYAGLGGVADELGKNSYDEIMEARKWQGKNAQEVSDHVKTLVNKTDPTTQAFTDFQIGMKNTEAAVQQLVLSLGKTGDLLNAFNTTVGQIVAQLQEQVNNLKNMGVDGKPNDAVGKTEHGYSVAGQNIDAATGGAGGALKISKSAIAVKDAVNVGKDAVNATDAVADGAAGAAKGLSKFAKVIGPLAAAIDIGFAGFGVYEANKLENKGQITHKEGNARRGEAIGTGVGGLAGMGAGALAGGAVGSAIPVVGTIVGAVVGGILGWLGGKGGGVIGRNIGESWDAPSRNYGKEVMLSKAEGGVVDGPRSGFKTMLHGMEAVVPLSGNRNIPVTIKGLNEILNMTTSFADIATNTMTARANNVPDITSLNKTITGTMGTMTSDLPDVAAMTSMMMNTQQDLMKTLNDFVQKAALPPTSTLPVTESPTSKKSEMADVCDLLKNQLTVMKDQVTKSERMLSVMSDHIDVSKNILNNSF